MPRATEFLERMTVIQRGDDALEALFHRGRGSTPVVLAPGHPRLYGTMESAVPAEVVWALSQRGHPTLRFNYRGVGASTGRSPIPPIDAHDPAVAPLAAALLEEPYADLCAALEQQLETSGEHACAVVGYSFGAALAARAGAQHERVERVVLIAPPVRLLPFDFEGLASSGAATIVVAGEEDRIAPPGEIERALGGRFGVQRIAGANHDFARGLSALGQRVAAAFPDGQERAGYDD